MTDRPNVPAEAVEIEVVRGLERSDLAALSAQPAGPPRGGLRELRYAHHRLAQLLASGVRPQEAGLVTGHSTGTVYRLSSQDPAFRELVRYYQEHREAVFVDAMERMKALGLHAVEELTERLEATPGEFSPRELMELTELMLVKGRAAPGGPGQSPAGGAASGAGGVTVNVKFVSPGGGASAPAGVVIDGEASGDAR